MISGALEFRSSDYGREKLEPGLSIPRHRHPRGYIAVVLGGGYQEAGLSGRFHLEAGIVIVHRAFDAHLDHIGPCGADVLNLPLPSGARLPAVFAISDPDTIARRAERDPQGAALALIPLRNVNAANDWPDQLAFDVAHSPEQTLGSWADSKGLSAETLSRGFRRAYGVPPARYRAETRAHRALHCVTECSTPLAEIAVACGFADQPHMTRAIVQLTGQSPGFWRRRSILFKTEDPSTR